MTREILFEGDIIYEDFRLITLLRESSLAKPLNLLVNIGSFQSKSILK